MKRMENPNPQVERILQQRDDAVEVNIRLHNISQRQHIEDACTIKNYDEHIAPKRNFKKEIIETIKYVERNAQSEVKYMYNKNNKEVRSEVTEKLKEDVTDTVYCYYESVYNEFNDDMPLLGNNN